MRGSPLILSWEMNGLVKSVEMPVGMPVVASNAGRKVMLVTCEHRVMSWCCDDAVHDRAAGTDACLGCMAAWARMGLLRPSQANETGGKQARCCSLAKVGRQG